MVDAPNDLLDELLRLEHAGWRALCDGTASSFYGDLMSDDALMVLANGDVMTRDEVVHALAGSPAWSSYSIDAPRIVAVSAEVAVLVYVGTARRDGGRPFVGAMSSVYHRRDDRWVLALYQQTGRA